MPRDPACNQLGRVGKWVCIRVTLNQALLPPARACNQPISGCARRSIQCRMRSHGV